VIGYRRAIIRRIFAVVLCIVVLTAAQAAFGLEQTIYPGIGIGKVELGMTATQVKQRLGAHYLLNDTTTVAGKRYVEYGWNYSRWVVTFGQEGRKLRVVQVATDLHDQRTSKGVGFGTLWQRLVHAYPGGRCGWGNHYSPYGEYVEYLVDNKAGTQTLYSLEMVFGGHPARIVDYKVIEVRVRSPFEPLDEFGSKRQYRCSDDWRTTDTPTKLPA
jgi:hypothetical protein